MVVATLGACLVDRSDGMAVFYRGRVHTLDERGYRVRRCCACATSGAPEEFFDAVNGTEVVHDLMLVPPKQELTHVAFRCEVLLFNVGCPTEVSCVSLDKMSLPCSFNTDVACNARWCRIASFTVP